jgi:hypothetical protein|uniref:Uncharacterized protein n=1 Tax=viral metagenome TaxID=1070528 RepID=A0A6C0LZM8_9ZZZZ
MSGKKVCINSNSSYYTGKEQSPLHFGLSAEGYDINAIMEGYDKELWIVEVRNNKKVWTKKDHINKMTYEKPLISESNDISTNNNENNNVDILNTQDNTPIINSSANDPIAISISNPNNEDKNKDKSSKTIKPTDYTLFITYRIHQMKDISNDNKKNYDCARHEWKEYKNKPNELKTIMIEANNFSKVNSKINKK